MRIFTSWSGERSKSAALALKSLLQDIFQENVQVFVSDHITPGELWAQRIGTELEQSDFGILCLTHDNYQAPWLLFEAGAVARKFGAARVVPYLIDELPEDAERSPLAQFQHVCADHDGTLRLVEAINSARENPKASDKLKRLFDRWWPDLEQTLEALRQDADGQPEVRTEREVLNIILQRVEWLCQAQNSGGLTKPLPLAEVAHLRNLRDRPTTVYTRSWTVQKELRHLRDSELIKNKKPIADLPEQFPLNQFFVLTEKGKDYLNEQTPLHALMRLLGSAEQPGEKL